MAESADELYQNYKDKENDFQGLFGRMDSDKSLAKLDEFILKDFDDKDMKKVKSTTLNDPKTYGKKVESNLQSADPQVVVISEVEDPQLESAVEGFIDDLNYEADALRTRQVKGPIFPFLCQQAAYRGWVAGASLIRLDKKGKLICERRPLDTRCVRYETDIDGLLWASYTTNRSTKLLKSQYDISGKVNLEGKTSVDVVDIYGREKEVIYVDDICINEQEHPFKTEENEGYVPFVIQPMPTGFYFEDEDVMLNDGESIYAMDRAIYPKLNELVSILENINLRSFFANQIYQRSPADEDPPEDFEPFSLAQEASIPNGAKYYLMDVADIKQATRYLLQILESRRQRGSLPDIDFGSTAFAMSAVGIGRLKEAGDSVYTPILMGLAKFFQQWDAMAINQYIKIGQTMKLGPRRKEFNPKDLQGEYTISRKFFTHSQEERIANTEIGIRMSQLGYSQETIMQVMGEKDPNGELLKAGTERARRMNPVLDLREQARQLILQENPDYMAAEIVLQTAEKLIRQQGPAPAVQDKPMDVPGNQKSLVSLLENNGVQGMTNGEKMNDEDAS